MLLFVVLWQSPLVRASPRGRGSGVGVMGGDVNGWKRVGDDSDQAEAAFRETLHRLRADGASKQEIAEAVMRSPFILGLVWIVTSRNYVARRRGPKSEA